MKFLLNKSLATFSFLLLAIPVGHAEESAPVQRVSKTRLSPEVHGSISKGLEFLSKNQNSDGSWGQQNHPVADTSVALMAFMLQGTCAQSWQVWSKYGPRHRLPDQCW